MKKAGMSRTRCIEALMENMHGIRRKMMLQGGFDGVAPKITFAQMRVLSCVVERGESSLKEISSALGITSSAATQLVDALVEAGYVERRASREDRRVACVALLPKANAFFTTLKKKMAERMTQFFTVLSDAELEEFVGLSRKVLMGKQHEFDTMNNK